MENYCLSCGGHSHQSMHCPNVIPTTQCPCHPSPEPTFTLAQVKEIIEGIAVRVETLVGWTVIPGFGVETDDEGQFVRRKAVLAAVRRGTEI